MSVRTAGWALFDAIVDSAPAREVSPWAAEKSGQLPTFRPDFATLARLLAVPVHLKANSQSGVPALALDVWAAYEFRRAGFDPDALWPRPRAPRVLPSEVSAVLAAVPAQLRGELTRRLESTSGLRGLPGASATILGKNYVKQVDVGMSSWRTGPELLVSTKRMDSSFAKNAANRVEESYGDAKNLRLRYPQAALGFLYGLRSTALTEEPDKASWLKDLLTKLGREDDAYHAVALVVPEWSSDGNHVVDDGDTPDEDAFLAAGLASDPTTYDNSPSSRGRGSEDEELPIERTEIERTEIERTLAVLPSVVLRHDAVPPELAPSRFFEVMIRRILDNCPINFHREARALYDDATG